MSSGSSLVKMARGLDQGGPDALPEKLDRVWAALCITSEGDFHAAEAVILRWLLKQMSGSSDEAEKLRRWPLAWSIMGCCFRRIPLFSLAKSLADRRFIAIIQQTASDFARRQEEASDVEMGNGTNSLKRKRTQETPFDLAILRSPYHSLQSAGALFDSLRILLRRLSSSQPTNRSSGDRAGSEHIKSLFCSPVAEALTLLTPLLSICNQALEEDGEPPENQETWVSTLDAIWKLHLQSPSDASMVAMSLAPRACVILGRLLGIPKPRDVPLPPAVAAAWCKDLQHFLTNTVILPARSAFLNRRQTSILDAAIGDARSASSNTALESAVLFYLVLKAPPILGNATAKSDNENWTQKVFELVEGPLQRLSATERNEFISALINMAAEHNVSPSLESLLAVCKDYAVQGETVDWQLISSTARCDVDAFIASSQGSEFLDLLLHRLSSSSPLDETGIEAASRFLISLSRGFARARDLSGFVKKWFEHLARCEPGGVTANTAASAWFSTGLAEAVTELLQPSLSTQQLTSLLSWLESQAGSSADLARVVIFAALCAGINEEEYVDAAGTRLLVPIQDDGNALPSEVRSTPWQIVSSTLRWTTFEEAQRIWKDIKGPLTDVLDKSETGTRSAFEGFKCAVTASILLGHDEGGINARAIVIRFLSRLNALTTDGGFGRQALPATELSETDLLARLSPDDYLRWCLGESTRFVEWALEAGDELPEFITKSVRRILRAADDSKITMSQQDEGRATKSRDDYDVLDSLLLGLATFRNLKGAPASIDTVLGILQDSLVVRPWQQENRRAARALLSAPRELLTRQLREKLMRCVLGAFKGLRQDHDSDILSDCTLILSLMIKLMAEPTFYEDMAFQDLVDIGTFLDSSNQRESVQDALGVMGLFRQLGVLTTRQMTSSGDEREKVYFKGAAEVMSAWPPTLPDSHLVLLSTFLSAAERFSTSRIFENQAEFLANFQSGLAVGIASVLRRAFPLVPESRVSVGNSTSLSAWIALDASKLDSLHGPLHEQLMPHLPALEAAAGSVGALDTNLEWKLKIFLAQHFNSDLQAERELQFRGILPGLEEETLADTASSKIYAFGDVLFEDYLLAVTSNQTEETLYSYLEDLVESKGARSPGQLLAIHYVAKQLGGKTKPAGPFDLATVHSILALELPRSTSPACFEITAQTLVMLLGEKASSMSQWNIEATLSGVSTICQDTTVDSSVRSSPRTYPLLCRLVEIVIKRHRVRLEGHFHLLIMTLQSLLSSLITQRGAAPSTETLNGARPISAADKKEHSKRFSRLLELVCEPSVASVTRAQQNVLNSATQAAKRSAGQHMYLVLMAYIKLQLEHNVPVTVREALEPGVFSILSITTDEGRAIMNDAMDSSGRAIFREVYRRWQRFGKWQGI